jgi:hypothetical protein
VHNETVTVDVHCSQGGTKTVNKPSKDVPAIKADTVSARPPHENLELDVIQKDEDFTVQIFSKNKKNLARASSGISQDAISTSLP